MATPYANRSTASSVSESSFANTRGDQSIYPSSRIYDERGNIWQYQPTSSMSPRPRLAKIKSSPSNGALAAARTAGQQQPSRLHKRNNSTSTPVTTDIDASKMPSTGLSDGYALASPKFAAGSKTKVKMKPLLRKFSSRDDVNGKNTATIDLSRSAAENEGLGIFTSHRNDPRPTTAPTMARRAPAQPSIDISVPTRNFPPQPPLPQDTIIRRIATTQFTIHHRRVRTHHPLILP